MAFKEKKNLRGELKKMAKRIFAWILLIGFVMLLLNIIVFHAYLIQSFFVYCAVAIYFIFFNQKVRKKHNLKVVRFHKRKHFCKRKLVNDKKGGV